MGSSQRGPAAKRKVSNAEAINLVSSEGEGESADDFEGRASKLQKGSSPLCPDLYNKTCRCKKDSPYCLAGVIPAPGGHRKKGLWVKDSKALLSQGPNPANLIREVGPKPKYPLIEPKRFCYLFQFICGQNAQYAVSSLSIVLAGLLPMRSPQFGKHMLCEWCSTVPFHDSGLQTGPLCSRASSGR